ncbi:hypothetical protein [Acidipropionibacterium jensenii]|uniref:hypothetical protein n=1 Tax=Acidipropionibacterium jensenii TaxID=1749 RepID=UPI00214C60F1|nr:hypothetical protein [Acidipropionibacterium jensenii]
MGRRTVAAAMAVVMIGAVLAGCERDSESGASPTVAVSDDTRPSATPTPTLTPSPTPSEDALFLEAKEVHLKYLEQFVALEKAGGSATLPKSMKVVVGGKYEVMLEKGFSDFKARGLSATPDSKWNRVSVIPAEPKGTHETALSACVDFREMTYVKRDTPGSSPGGLRRDDLQLDRRGSSLVIVEGSSELVKSCDL